jgi:hypothetical protein
MLEGRLPKRRLVTPHYAGKREKAVAIVATEDSEMTKITALFAMCVVLFTLASDSFAGAARFWIGDVSPADLPKKTYDKYVWNEFPFPDPTSTKWLPIDTAFVPDGRLVVRLNSFADEAIPPQVEYRIYKKLPKLPLAGPSSTDPDVQPRCMDCHGGGAKLPPPKDSPAPPRPPSDSKGGGEDSRGGGEDSRGGPGDTSSGDEDAFGGTRKEGDTDKKKEEEKQLKRLLSSLSKGENPWRVGTPIESVDTGVWDERYVGQILPINPHFIIPLGGDSKRPVGWLYIKTFREKNPKGEEYGPTKATILQLSNKKK